MRGTDIGCRLARFAAAPAVVLRRAGLHSAAWWRGYSRAVLLLLAGCLAGCQSSVLQPVAQYSDQRYAPESLTLVSWNAQKASDPRSLRLGRASQNLANLSSPQWARKSSFNC